MAETLLAGYAPAFARCEPYLVTPEWYHARLDLAPLGIRVPRHNVMSPHDIESAPFLTLLQRLDELAYGPRGMKMPRWVFYDCAEMVGGIFGLGRRARALPAWARDSLGVEPGYDGLVPLSLLIAVPLQEEGAFLCYSLCSMNQVAPGAGPSGLRLLTLVLGLVLFRVRAFHAVTQWRSPTLSVHARLGPLALLTAYTPAHSIPATLTFRLEVSPARLRRTPGKTAPRPHRWIDADDERALRSLQREIEDGARYEIVGPPRSRGAVTRVPLWRGRRAR